ncbi:hypothetical protein H4R19_001011 [Coemansia spiralis]|nr:hypothetical protein H4R19_001011 [Coemansia spiralis]
MGENWKVFCLDNRQMTNYTDFLRVGGYYHPHDIEYELFRGRVASHPFLASLPVPPPTAPLELLLSLIKHRICAFLATIDIDGLLCVIMAVPHMAADGQAALNSAMMWAGRRIINVGDYAECLPQNLLTKDEERLWLGSKNETRWILDTSKFVDISKGMRNCGGRAMDYIRASQRSTRPLPYDLASDLLAPSVKRPDNAVLRNLTLKQYYRGSNCYTFCHCNCGKPKDNKNSDVDDIEFGLGQVAFIMTCWSDDPPTSSHADGTREDVRSEWAGHRLDIVAAETVNPDWEDVTVAVKKKLRSFFGEED